MTARFHGTVNRGATPYLIAALLGASASDLLAQHEHRPPAASDTTRRDTSAAPPGEMPAVQHSMQQMMEGLLGISHARLGSGTSWMPDSSPMHANHKMWGDWTVMLHGVAFLQYDDQGSRRGDRQLGVIDWEMLMAMRKVGAARLHLHGMWSLEPLTIGAKGYPLLLQTGESYRGTPLHDRQHPHDLFMELAAIFEQPIAPNLAVQLYGGAVGEPALGPVAFMHRPSAQSDPLAPLGHHWQDATHISYGVVTAGVYSRTWKLEGSWFNGREPDENRWDLDFRRLDSYSGRLTINPTPRLSLAGWYGYLRSPEELHPDEPVHRYGVSTLYAGRGVRGGAWESMLLWGANEHGGRAENSVVAESNLELGRKNTVLARAEYVRKSGEDLVLPGIDPERHFDIRNLVLGYMREIGSIPGGTIGVGGRASVNFISAALEPFYGTRTPAGVAVYLRVRPKRMQMEHGGTGTTGHGQRMEHAPGHPMLTPPTQEAAPASPQHPAAQDSTPGMPEVATDRDSAAVVRAVEQFHSALAAADSASVLALLHDSALVLESGELETRVAYRAQHLPADIAFARAVRNPPRPTPKP